MASAARTICTMFSMFSISPGRRRDCHFAVALSPSLLKQPLKVEGGAAE